MALSMDSLSTTGIEGGNMVPSTTDALNDVVANDINISISNIDLRRDNDTRNNESNNTGDRNICARNSSNDSISNSCSNEQINTSVEIPFPCVSICGSKHVRLNHNVLLNLILCVLYGLSESLWNGTANAAYLKKLGGNRNSPLGDIEAVNGLAMLVTALPVGYLADKVGRAKVIAAGGVLLLVTSVAQIAFLQWEATHDSDDNDLDMAGSQGIDDDDNQHTTQASGLWVYAIIMAGWGIADSVVNGPAAALYADSTSAGERTKYYTYLFAVYTLASSVGPIVSIILFQTLGDSWDLYDLRLIIYVGLAVGIVSSFVMMFFDDEKALKEKDDQQESQDQTEQVIGTPTNSSVNSETSPDSQVITTAIQDKSNVKISTFSDAFDIGTQYHLHELPREEENQEQGQQSQQQQITTNPSPLDSLPPPVAHKRKRWIPYIIFLQGLMFAIGSGMTVKFFPLFFKDEVNMTPSQVQGIYVVVPIVMVVCSRIAEILAKSFGRVQVTLLFDGLGVSFLYLMVFFKKSLDRNPVLLVPIYVFRTSFINSCYPLQESILMDSVPKEERARWKSLDSVAAFGWCGSAAFGGWLSDKYDYTYTFFITAIIQTLATLMFAMLLPLVPKEEVGSIDDSENNNIDSHVNESEVLRVQSTVSMTTEGSELSEENSLHEPLLRQDQLSAI